MLFHGTTAKLGVGDTLLPGEVLGKSANGACSKYVYATADFGFSMTDVADWMSSDSLRTTQEFACWDAALWGCAGTEDENAPVWVYVVEGDIVGMDEHMDAGPAAVRLDRATITHVIEVKRTGFSVDIDALKKSLAAI